MGLVVNSNTQSLFAQRALSKNTEGLKRNIEQLSTGYRINRAADDAAGLSISNKLTTTIRGLEKAKQNASDGISLLQTAEGGLSVIQENLQRIRELVVQGVNGTNNTPERDAIQNEINERVKLIQGIADATKFNGKTLLTENGELVNGEPNDPDIVLYTGANSGDTTTISFKTGVTANTGIEIDITQVNDGSTDQGHLVENITTAGFALNRIQLKDSSVDSVSGTNVEVSVGDVDTMIDNVSRMRSYIGANQNALESKIEYIDIATENASASRSRIQDTDIAYESSVLVRNQILQQTASAMLSQANSQPQIALRLLGN